MVSCHSTLLTNKCILVVVVVWVYCSPPTQGRSYEKTNVWVMFCLCSAINRIVDTNTGPLHLGPRCTAAPLGCLASLCSGPVESNKHSLPLNKKSKEVIHWGHFLVQTVHMLFSIVMVIKNSLTSINLSMGAGRVWWEQGWLTGPVALEACR